MDKYLGFTPSRDLFSKYHDGEIIKLQNTKEFRHFFQAVISAPKTDFHDVASSLDAKLDIGRFPDGFSLYLTQYHRGIKFNLPTECIFFLQPPNCRPNIGPDATDQLAQGEIHLSKITGMFYISHQHCYNCL